MRLWILIGLVLTLAPRAAAGAFLPLAPIIINHPDFPPYFFRDEQGRSTGITTEVLSACLNEMRRPFVFVRLPIERMQVSMQEGLIDIHTYSYKADRESFVSFGRQELFRTEYRPFVAVDSTIRIQKLEDFDRLRLGHIIGLRYSPEFMKYVEKRQKAHNLDEAATTEQNLRKLVAGRIDTFVNAVEPTLYVARRIGFTQRIKTLEWVPHDGHYFTAVSRNSPRIRDRESFLGAIDGCVDRMKRDGRFCAIYRSYGLDCPNLPGR